MRAVLTALLVAAVGCGGAVAGPSSGGGSGASPGGAADAGVTQDGGVVTGDAGVAPQDAGVGATDGGAVAADAGSAQSGTTRWFSTDPTMVPYTGLAANLSGDVIGVGLDGRIDARDPNGNVLWVRAQPVRDAMFVGVDVSPGSGNIAAHGSVNEAGGGSFIARYAPDGTNPQLTYVCCQDNGIIGDDALSTADDLLYASNIEGGDSTLTYTTVTGTGWDVDFDGGVSSGSMWISSPVAVDLQRNAVGSGLASGAVTLQGRTFGTAGTRTPTLLEFSAGGTLQWVETLDGFFPAPYVGISGFTRVRTSNAGTVVALGTFQGTASWGGEQVTADGPVLLTAEASGAQRWMKAPPVSEAYVMAVDPTGKVALVGEDVVKGAQSQCMALVVLQYDLAGQLLWTREITPSGCSGRVTATAAASVSGDIVVGGTFQGTVDFGTGPWSAASSQPFILDLRP